MGKPLVIHPQTEQNAPPEYVIYLRRVLSELAEVSEALLCGLKDFDSEGEYTGVSISSDPLPPESALSAIALRLNSDDDVTFERVCNEIQSTFAADGISGPVIFNGFKFKDIWERLKERKALVAFQRRYPIALASYHDLSTDLYNSIDRCPEIWNGIASYWFLWRTKETIDVMRAESAGRLHVHVGPNVNLVELAKRLLVLSDSVTFWYAGPITFPVGDCSICKLSTLEPGTPVSTTASC
ncbi:MAG: hypothetical protein KKG33_06920 [candidate division Zixibacteria bacterium]|nr:hypothetical protein [candidate division Zixibacteria bacterium]MBU2625274.1 hypothetical protein [candidate division Zixibacteria bacterium]